MDFREIKRAKLKNNRYTVGRNGSWNEDGSQHPPKSSASGVHQSMVLSSQAREIPSICPQATVT